MLAGVSRRATTILRYLDNQGRADHQTEACDDHASARPTPETTLRPGAR
jgi:hypothetical protein